MNAGGESFAMIPCLNTNLLWVKTIADWIKLAKMPDAMMLDV